MRIKHGGSATSDRAAASVYSVLIFCYCLPSYLNTTKRRMINATRAKKSAM